MANETPIGFQLVQGTTHRPILSQIVSLRTPTSSVGEIIIPAQCQSFNVSCRLYHACAAAKKTGNMKVFMIRNLNRGHFSSLEQLREEVLRQLGSNVVSEISDMGYMKGATTKVCINFQDDLLDVWHKVESGKECVLWCDVPNAAKTRKHPS